MSAKQEGKHAVLQYAEVPKIVELEALLVRNCTKRLEEFGLTLWVVSIVLYVQESQGLRAYKKFFLCLCAMCHAPCHVAVYI